MLPALFPSSSLTPPLFQAKETNCYSSQSFALFCLHAFAGGGLSTGMPFPFPSLPVELLEQCTLLQEAFPVPFSPLSPQVQHSLVHRAGAHSTFLISRQCLTAAPGPENAVGLLGGHPKPSGDLFQHSLFLVVTKSFTPSFSNCILLKDLLLNTYVLLSS